MGHVSNSGMVRVVHLLAASVLLIVAICGLFVLHSAGTIADEIHRKDTKLLVENELSRQVAIVARDQSQISNWDDTLKALGKEIDKSFVRREIANWLWEDFDLKTTVILGPDKQPRVTVFKSKVVSPEQGVPFVDQNRDLLETARKLYFENRRRTSRGYSFPIDPTRPGSIAYASDFRKVDGQLGIVLAQAIVPSDGFVLPDGDPHILLVYKPINERVLSTIRTKLNFQRFEVSEAPANSLKNEAAVRFGTSNFWAIWQENSPSTAIWQQSMAPIALMLLLIGAALTVLSIRYARLFSELQENQEKNRFLALHDALTGLPNRVQFDQVLSELVENGTFSGSAVLCIDLDRFKAVNDTHGHQAGDMVLTTVAARISAVVSDYGMVARMGGDEFIALLRNVSDREAVIEICNDIVLTVSEEIQIDGGVAHVGASIGVAHWPNFETTAKFVIQNADKALYRAKEDGRGRVHFSNYDHRADQSEKSEAA